MQPRTARGLTGALLSLLALAACSQDGERPVPSVAYFRSHAAQWEERVWGCTNELPAFERSSDCVNALLALKSVSLPEAHEAKAPSRFPASTD